MSAQAGIWYFDSKPIEPSTREALTWMNKDLGPDRLGSYVADGLMMLSFASHFDRLSQGERQPILTAAGTMLTWDGRLDNRDDFIVCSQPELSDDFSDAHIIAQALAKWGEACLRRVIGDWSLACWFASDRHLLLARDYAGNRPLYYYWCPRFVTWSTTLDPIADVCGLDDDVNDSYMAGWLTFDPPHDHTVYRGIYMVPAGNAVHVRADRPPATAPFVQLMAAKSRYRHASQYRERYRELFTEAVKVRLRARRVVWAELSGGYDSSSVVSVANALTRSGSVETPALQPVSRVDPQSPESDERPYIQSVEAFCGIRSLKTAYEYLDVDQEAWSLPPLEGYPYVPSPAVLASRTGAHVVMTGLFGDSVTAPVEITDALRAHLLAGRVRTLLVEYFRHCRVQKGMFARLPHALMIALTKSGRRLDGTADFAPSAMANCRQVDTADVALIYGLRRDFVERAFVPTKGTGTHTTDGSDGYRILLDGVQIWVSHNYLHAGQPGHVARLTHPFSHRPLIEFVLGVPPAIMWSAAHPRAFALSALRDVLPSAVLRRGFKGNMAAAITRDLRELVTRALPDLANWMLVKRGYAEPELVADIFGRFVDGSAGTAFLILRLVRAEVLLQRVHSRYKLRTNTLASPNEPSNAAWRPAQRIAGGGVIEATGR